MAELFIYPKKGEPSTFGLTGRRVSIGRASSNDIVLADQFSSGCHAVIFPTERGYAVQDQGSKNGTSVNGRRITGQTELVRGDEIVIGSTRIFFDRDIQTNVEMIEGTTFTHSSNTIIQVRDILKKPQATSVLKPPEGRLDLDLIRHDQKIVAVMGEVSQALIYHMPLDKLLNHIMDLLTQHIAMDRGVLMLRGSDPDDLVPKVVRITSGPLKTQSIFVSRSIVRMALEKNSAVLISDIQSDKQLGEQESVVQAQIHSAMCVPLWNNEKIIGLIYADRASLLEQFTEDDLRLLTLLANLAANKIENAILIDEKHRKDQMDREIQTAVQIQRNFLPKADPVFEPFDVNGSTRACYQVGGDYYDYIRIDDRRMGIAVADVSGKGVSASLLMASLRAMLHATVPSVDDLGQLAARLNNFVYNSSDSHGFITFFFAVLDREAGEGTYVNAGHNPPLIISPDGGVRTLPGTGMSLGMFPDEAYETKSFALGPGEILCLFTDGITEHRDSAKAEYGDGRLVSAIRGSAALGARDIMEKVYEDVFGFADCSEPGDDMTLVIVKRKA